jgi:hypothetical protein
LPQMMSAVAQTGQLGSTTLAILAQDFTN